MPKQSSNASEICSTFCTYYKPGKNEDMACQGFLVVRSMLKRGRNIPVARPEKPAQPGPGLAAGLEKRVCGACSFRDQDCDYIASGGRAPSCGGLALLRHLLGSGEIRLGEITGPEKMRKK